MKKIIMIVLSIILLTGCLSKRDNNNIPYDFKVIDSCEYIDGGSFSTTGHKGNCKFCEERRKAELRELKKEILKELKEELKKN